ncbi:hypothetical protein B0I37DRAFT_191837 [Chaetomium sp. MPI-CAGE-AT-0009]|nr:hypothetical protein B0I37DRAFT_191837 [Chaetomium sp. MPI-CAGE-AT-0009]
MGLGSAPVTVGELMLIMLTQSEACERPLSFAIPGCGEPRKSGLQFCCHVAPNFAPNVGVPALLPPQDTAVTERPPKRSHLAPNCRGKRNKKPERLAVTDNKWPAHGLCRHGPRSCQTAGPSQLSSRIWKMPSSGTHSASTKEGKVHATALGDSGLLLPPPSRSGFTIGLSLSELLLVRCCVCFGFHASYCTSFVCPSCRAGHQDHQETFQENGR